MAAPRKPQDRLPKDADKTGTEAPFHFDHAGQSFELRPPAEVMTGGFIRKNRHLSTQNQFWLLVEALADEKALAAVDSMNASELKEFQTAFYKHLEVPLGESQASATS
jgi:hypothetical protein